MLFEAAVMASQTPAAVCSLMVFSPCRSWQLRQKQPQFLAGKQNYQLLSVQSNGKSLTNGSVREVSGTSAYTIKKCDEDFGWQGKPSRNRWFVIQTYLILLWCEQILEFLQFHHTKRANTKKFCRKITLHVIIFCRPATKRW